MAVFTDKHIKGKEGFFTEVQEVYEKVAPGLVSMSLDTPNRENPKEANPLVLIHESQLDRDIEYSSNEYIGLLKTFSGHIALGNETLDNLCEGIRSLIDTKYGGRIVKIINNVLGNIQMKAIVYTKYGPPDVLELAEVEKPTPTEDEVLIKLHAVSINLSDWENLRGKPLYARIGGLLRPKNKILGSDVAGRVESAGRNVTHLKPGDEVFGELPGYHGGFAEYACASLPRCIAVCSESR